MIPDRQDERFYDGEIVISGGKYSLCLNGYGVVDDSALYAYKMYETVFVQSVQYSSESFVRVEPALVDLLARVPAFEAFDRQRAGDSIASFP